MGTLRARALTGLRAAPPSSLGCADQARALLLTTTERRAGANRDAAPHAMQTRTRGCNGQRSGSTILRRWLSCDKAYAPDSGRAAGHIVLRGCSRGEAGGAQRMGPREFQGALHSGACKPCSTFERIDNASGPPCTDHSDMLTRSYSVATLWSSVPLCAQQSDSHVLAQAKHATARALAVYRRGEVGLSSIRRHGGAGRSPGPGPEHGAPHATTKLPARFL